MAAGLLALAQYVGIIIAMLITPALVGSNPELANYGSGFEQMLWIYGIIGLVAALACLVLIRERPRGFKTEDTERYPFFKGLGHILHNRDMLITMLLFLIGLGIFNAISSMTDSISAKAGVKDSDGLIGGLMLIGGIVGAIIIPTLSDKFRKRKPFILLCIGGMVPAVAGLAFAGQIASDPDGAYTISLVSSFILGFFVMSAGPIGFQYAAEVSHPAPESASQGILLWVGQLTGMIFVAGMSIKNNLYLGSFMSAFVFMSLLAITAAFFLRESPMIKSN
jgi:Na+/melibiose symporter-like transporter